MALAVRVPGRGRQLLQQPCAQSSRDAIKGDPTAVEHYLLEVDKPVVVPVNTKVRFVITSNDVIHSWWVPALGWKQDAIPGFINDGWTNIPQPGVYRGQCAELCGKDHGFMPVVIEAKTQCGLRDLAGGQEGRGRGGQERR